MTDFLDELESSLSKIGTQKLYKKMVGGHLLWFSPVTLEGQERITELMSNASNVGVNIIHETKRTTLANSLVGIDGTDLRPYRDGPPTLTIHTPGSGRVKVSLEKFLYHKMGGWSSQFIDDAFTVYADIIETDQKENLKDIVFENLKSPRDEHDELLAKVQKLRSELGMPPLVVSGGTEDDLLGDPEDVPEEFNPFKPIKTSMQEAAQNVNNSRPVNAGELSQIPSEK